MNRGELEKKIAYSEDWLVKQRKALAMAVIQCKEIVDAIEKTEREIASMQVFLEGNK